MKHLCVLVLLPCLFAPALAENCEHLMKDLKPDAEAARRVEREWSRAFLTGETDYLECLLEPDSQSVWYTGKIRGRQEIIDTAGAHRANPIPIPSLTTPIVQVHGSTAIFRTDIDMPDPSTKESRKIRFLDIFSYYGGRWHVLYTQDVELRPQ
jgi:hypothetical protein